MTIRKAVLAGVTAASLASCGAAPKTNAPAAPLKRIVLITIDTWRTDALGASGSGRVETPNLDKLSTDGLFFPRAWSSATLTAPSHATILTGLQPYHHGVRDNHGFRLSSSTPTLATVLRQNGYATAAFVSAHPLARVSGLDSGFTVYDDRCAPGNPLSVMPRWRRGSETIDAALAWLRTAPERYFLWVHVYEPHDPYAPPEPYRTRYSASPYFGEVAYTDELVGRLKSAVGAPGDDALLIVAGDHGEALGDHGEATHSLFVYGTTAQVPLIFWAPGSISSAKGDFARLVDIAPTVLSLAGLPLPAGLDGRSLVPAGTATEPHVAYTETMYPFLNFGAAPVRALTDGRYKIIDVPQREIYDLRDDPAESRNLEGTAPPPEVDALRTALATLPAAPPVPSRKGVDDDDAKALKSLGYIGAGGEYTLENRGMDPKLFAPLFRKLSTVHELCEAGRLAEAVPLYAQLLSVFPRSSVLACELGLVEMALGRTSEAEAHLRLALDRDPGNAPALLGMANLALGRSDYASAETFLLDALALDPDDPEANFNLGALYVQGLRTPAKAVPYWQRFLTLQPADPEAPRIRGMLAEIAADGSRLPAPR